MDNEERNPYEPIGLAPRQKKLTEDQREEVQQMVMRGIPYSLAVAMVKGVFKEGPY